MAHKRKRKKPPRELQQPLSKKPRGKLCQCTNGEMLHVIEYGQSSAVSINEASQCYKIPPTILKDGLSGRVVHETKMDSKPYLTHEEEKELVEFLINCAIKNGL